jgi:uracil phosphoribosyltransferase
MAITYLENKLNDKEASLLEVCKSTSGVRGKDLRNAHYQLGQRMGVELLNGPIKEVTHCCILIMMRAGLPFGTGIADSLENEHNKIEVHFIHNDTVDKNIKSALADKQIILVDAVVNSGNSVKRVLNQLSKLEQTKTIITTTVVPTQINESFPDFPLFSIRKSDNYYKGAKVSTIKDGLGPDTGDRLFSTLS